MMSFVYTIDFVVFITPLVYIVFCFKIRNRTAVRNSIAKYCCLIAFFSSIFAVIGLRFIYSEINVLFVLFIYMMYSAAIIFITLEGSVLRLIKFLSWLPMPIVYVSIFTEPLGLSLYVIQATEPPLGTQHIEPDLTCEWSNWGNLFTDEGRQIDLYRDFTELFLRLKVRDWKISDSGPERVTNEQACKMLMQSYSSLRSA